MYYFLLALWLLEKQNYQHLQFEDIIDLSLKISYLEQRVYYLIAIEIMLFPACPGVVCHAVILVVEILIVSSVMRVNSFVLKSCNIIGCIDLCIWGFRCVTLSVNNHIFCWHLALDMVNLEKAVADVVSVELGKERWRNLNLTSAVFRLNLLLD